jgi:hypothetical protein
LDHSRPSGVPGADGQAGGTGLSDYSQTDEDEMGMTYEELDTFGYVHVP